MDESFFTRCFNTMLPNVAIEILSQRKGQWFYLQSHKTRKSPRKRNGVLSSILTRHSDFYTHLNVVARNRAMPVGDHQAITACPSPGLSDRPRFCDHHLLLFRPARRFFAAKLVWVTDDQLGCTETLNGQPLTNLNRIPL